MTLRCCRHQGGEVLVDVTPRPSPGSGRRVKSRVRVCPPDRRSRTGDPGEAASGVAIRKPPWSPADDRAALGVDIGRPSRPYIEALVDGRAPSRPARSRDCGSRDADDHLIQAAAARSTRLDAPGSPSSADGSHWPPTGISRPPGHGAGDRHRHGTCGLLGGGAADDSRDVLRSRPRVPGLRSMGDGSPAAWRSRRRARAAREPARGSSRLSALTAAVGRDAFASFHRLDPHRTPRSLVGSSCPSSDRGRRAWIARARRASRAPSGPRPLPIAPVGVPCPRQRAPALPRRDQGRAHRLRAAVRLPRHGAGGARLARVARRPLDHRGHGRGADDGDGGEPADRPPSRRPEPADGGPPPPARAPRAARPHSRRRRLGRALLRGGVAARAALPRAGPGRARLPGGLLLHEALHVALALDPRVHGRRGGGRRLDRRARDDGAAGVAPLARRHRVDRGLRPPLRLPGRRVRPAGGAPLGAGPVRDRRRAPGRARLPRPHRPRPRRRRLEPRARRALLGRLARRGRGSSSTSTRSSRRPTSRGSTWPSST